MEFIRSEGGMLTRQCKHELVQEIVRVLSNNLDGVSFRLIEDSLTQHLLVDDQYGYHHILELKISESI